MLTLCVTGAENFRYFVDWVTDERLNTNKVLKPAGCLSFLQAPFLYLSPITAVGTRKVVISLMIYFYACDSFSILGQKDASVLLQLLLHLLLHTDKMFIFRS